MPTFGRAEHGESFDAGNASAEPLLAGENSGDPVTVTLKPQILHYRPRRRDRPAGTGPSEIQGRIDTGWPLGIRETLKRLQITVAQQQARRTSVGISVLVKVDRQGANVGDPEVEARNSLAEILRERQHESADAGIDVHPQIVCFR